MKMSTFWENERRKLLGQPLIQDDDNQANTAISAPQTAVLQQAEEEDILLMSIETFTEKGAYGGDGNKQTGELQASLYFMFDADILVDFQKNNVNPNTALTNYIQNFKNSVANVWNTFTYKSIAVSVDAVHFLPIDASMQANNNLHNLFVVGNGGSNLKDDGNQVSYVASGKFEMRNTLPATPINLNRPNTWGYFYYENGAIISYAAHEFGHIFGLTDRYHEGVKQVSTGTPSTGGTKENLEGRETIPMYLSPRIDPHYEPLNNLYSSNSATITQMQLDIVFNIHKIEKTYPTVVWIHKINEDIKMQGFIIGVNANKASIYEFKNNTWSNNSETLHYYGGNRSSLKPSTGEAKNFITARTGTLRPNQAEAIANSNVIKARMP